MSYANRSDSHYVYCPAIDDDVLIETIYHQDEDNYYRRHNLSHDCLDEDDCPFEECMCVYDEDEDILEEIG